MQNKDLAILVSAFGTSQETGKSAEVCIDQLLKKEFPEIPVYWSYTSRTIKNFLTHRKKVVFSPEEVLTRLICERYRKIYVLCLHVIPGKEYHSFYYNLKLISHLKKSISTIKITGPLIRNLSDLQKIGNTILKLFNPAEEEALVFMGHGTKHPAGFVYTALNAWINYFHPRIFLSAPDCFPDLSIIIKKLKKLKVKKIILHPFMFVAGEHALNDMAGDSPHSWQSILIKEGFECRSIIKGLGDYPEFAQIYISHLKEVFSDEE